MTLKEKAKLEEKMLNQKLEINNFLRESEEETEILKAYIQMVTEVVKEPPKTKEVIDFQQ